MLSRAIEHVPETVISAGRHAVAVGRDALARASAACRDAAATILPVDCPACSAVSVGVCAACRRELRSAAEPSMGRLTVGDECVPIASALEYEGVARSLLGALKERGRLDAVAPLAALARLAVTAAVMASCAPPLADSHGGHSPPAQLVVVPAPSRPSSTRRRGFVPIQLVCEAALPSGGVASMLTMRATTRDQAGLGRDDRAGNLAGAIRAGPAAAGARVVLVDDVVTTGATVNDACRALIEAGAEVVAVATIARAVRRDGVFPSWAGAR